MKHPRKNRWWAADFWLRKGSLGQGAVVVTERRLGDTVIADVQVAAFVGGVEQRARFGISWPLEDAIGYQSVFDISKTLFAVEAI